MCESFKQPFLKLRGLCLKSNLDDTYVPFNPQNSGKLVYRGLYGTVIEYDEEIFAWIAKKQQGPQFTTEAIIRASEESQLLGSYKWIVYNDTKKCSLEETYSKIHTLSRCEKDQFRKRTLKYLINLNLDFDPNFQNLTSVNISIVLVSCSDLYNQSDKTLWIIELLTLQVTSTFKSSQKLNSSISLLN